MRGDFVHESDQGRTSAWGEAADSAAPGCANRGMASICCERYAYPAFARVGPSQGRGDHGRARFWRTLLATDPPLEYRCYQKKECAWSSRRTSSASTTIP